MDPEVESRVQAQLEKPEAIFEITHNGTQVELKIARESMRLTDNDSDLAKTPIDGTWP